MRLRRTLNKAVNKLFEIFNDIEVNITLQGTDERYVDVLTGTVEKRSVAYKTTAIMTKNEINEERRQVIELILRKDSVDNMDLYDRLEIGGYGGFIIEKPIIDNITIYTLKVISMNG